MILVFIFECPVIRLIRKRETINRWFCPKWLYTWRCKYVKPKQIHTYTNKQIHTGIFIVIIKITLIITSTQTQGLYLHALLTSIQEWMSNFVSPCPPSSFEYALYVFPIFAKWIAYTALSSQHEGVMWLAKQRGKYQSFHLSAMAVKSSLTCTGGTYTSRITKVLIAMDSSLHCRHSFGRRKDTGQAIKTQHY